MMTSKKKKNLCMGVEGRGRVQKNTEAQSKGTVYLTFVRRLPEYLIPEGP